MANPVKLFGLLVIFLIGLQESVAKEKFGFNESCNEHDDGGQCDLEKYLTCRENKCQCAFPEILFYDYAKEKCIAREIRIGKVGDTCGPLLACTGDLLCSNNMCSCNNATSMLSSDGKTCVDKLLDHLQECGKLRLPECNREMGLECIDSKCQCEFAEHQEYREEDKTCVTLIGGPCQINLTKCTPESSCEKKEGTFPACQCKPGHLVVERKCQLGHGHVCGNQEITCSKLAGLRCFKGTCSCKSFETYDETRHRCRGLPGALCNASVVGFCVENSVCEVFMESSNSNQGTCKCSENFIYNETSKTCSSKEVVHKEEKTPTLEHESSSEEWEHGPFSGRLGLEEANNRETGWFSRMFG